MEQGGKEGLSKFTPKWDYFPTRRGSKEVEEGGFDSIYFSMILDMVKATDIYELFRCNGDIVEVNIAPFRNKIGKRFGFARFNKVEDVRMLAVRLNNIIIDGKKIHANPPRFSRTRMTCAGRANGAGDNCDGGAWRELQRRETEAHYGSSVKGGLLFADAVGNRKHGVLADTVIHPVLKFCYPVEQRR